MFEKTIKKLVVKHPIATSRMAEFDDFSEN
jgi:hypothetical protein